MARGAHTTGRRPRRSIVVAASHGGPSLAVVDLRREHRGRERRHRRAPPVCLRGVGARGASAPARHCPCEHLPAVRRRARRATTRGLAGPRGRRRSLHGGRPPRALRTGRGRDGQPRLQRELRRLRAGGPTLQHCRARAHRGRPHRHFPVVARGLAQKSIGGLAGLVLRRAEVA